MTENRPSVDVLSTDNPHELEKWASEAAHAKFAEWHRKEREERPRRILLFSLAAVVIVVVTIVVILTHGGA
jgi:t-SNARE complex subunit (syntaxin)